MWQVFGLLLCCVLAAGARADVYRWTDAQGRVHFGDRPPAGAASEPVEVRVNSYRAPQIVRPAPTAQGKARAGQRRVVMYSAAWCGVCKRARAYFRAHGIPYVEYDVETSARGRADFRRLGGRGVPVILVGEARMNGFSARHFEQLYRR